MLLLLLRLLLLLNLLKLMLKRLNFIKTSLDTFDPVKTKREFRKRIDKTREERIYELWKTDIRNVNIEDIARKIDTESSMARMGSVGASLDAAVANRSFASGDLSKHVRGASDIPANLN